MITYIVIHVKLPVLLYVKFVKTCILSRFEIKYSKHCSFGTGINVGTKMPTKGSRELCKFLPLNTFGLRLVG